ncbi:hypothetical protein ACTOB_003631 [Actinoplanes oblitus]|uniref:Transposase n=1 Tax=Actinoplanes oblitus TaxID=3040509 RepID=A0ABY8WVC6_9ACTN|nr:hypothetical protein [Actinoplanes oblitus]WIM99960.1 hypothetical protein ACTOB_003631 [Actinoplanes oblitus]
MLKLGEIEKVLNHGVAATVVAAARDSVRPASTMAVLRASAALQGSWASAASSAAVRSAAQQVIENAAVARQLVQSIRSSPALQAAVRPAAQSALAVMQQGYLSAGTGKSLWHTVPPRIQALLVRGKRRPTARQVKRSRARLQLVRVLVEKIRALKQTRQIPAEAVTLAENLVDALSEALLRVAFTIRLQVTEIRPQSTIVHTTSRQVRGPSTAGRVLTTGLRDGTRIRRGLPPFLGDSLVRREPFLAC